MIIGILTVLIISQVVSLWLILDIKMYQKTNHKILYKLYKHQHSMWDDITQIGRTVRTIDRKIDLNEHLKIKKDGV